MKKYIFVIAAIAALMVSCTKENNPGQDGKLTFKVSKEAIGTKAELSGTSVSFAAGDKISVFAGATNHEFTTTAGGATATFTSGDSVSELENYLVLSPYNADATRVSAGSMQVNITIPDVQVATPNGVDPKALISAGLATGTGSVELKNAVGLVEIVVPAGLTVKEIQISGGQAATIGICGDFTFNVDNLVLTPVKMKNVITMVPESGNTTIAPGTYYVAVRPKPDYDAGVCVAYVNASDQLCKRTTANTLNVNRSHIVPLGSLNEVNFTPVTGRATLRYYQAGVNVQFTSRIKTLAAGSDVGGDAVDNIIKKIVFKAHTMYAQGYKNDSKNLISNGPNTDVRIDAYVDGDVAYVCTEAPAIAFYSNSARLFESFAALEEVEFNNAAAMDNTSFQYLFEGCNNLKSVKFGTAEFSNVKDFSYMFYIAGTNALEYIDMGETATTAATTMQAMFNNAKYLKYLYLGPNFTLASTNVNMFLDAGIETSKAAGDDMSKKCQIHCSQAFYDDAKANVSTFIPARYYFFPL